MLTRVDDVWTRVTYSILFQAYEIVLEKLLNRISRGKLGILRRSRNVIRHFTHLCESLGISRRCIRGNRHFTLYPIFNMGCMFNIGAIPCLYEPHSSTSISSINPRNTLPSLILLHPPQCANKAVCIHLPAPAHLQQ